MYAVGSCACVNYIYINRCAKDERSVVVAGRVGGDRGGVAVKSCERARAGVCVITSVAAATAPRRYLTDGPPK